MKGTMASQSRVVVSATRTYEFRTDDLDEATEFLARNFGPNTRTLRDRGPLGFRLTASVTPRAATGSTALGLRNTLRATARSVIVHLPLRQGSNYRVGRRLLNSRADVAVLLAPGHEYTREAHSGLDLAIQVDPGSLQREFESRFVGRAGSSALRSIEIPIGPHERATFTEMIEQHSIVAGAPEGSAPGAIECVEDRIVAWMADHIGRVSGWAALSPSSRQAAERVEAWIRRHLSQPITLEQLSAVAGVVDRTLQEACKARWGQTPLELVASRRLEHVRALLTSRPATTVTAAALHSGFMHLGRFSILYRRTFGESPADTLTRTRQLVQTQQRLSAG
jgi:AraC-like DNA-binding protein